ncbi:MAG: hypothetical protein J6Y64_00485 [Ruminococcus sp.]|nr:hypothetical protein [Ruminococcus sp.]
MSVKAERKYLAHYIDINPLGDQSSAVNDTTNYVRIGKDLEEYNENLNPDVSTQKNILGENNVIHNGFDVSSDVDPFYVRLDDDTPEDLATKLMYIANERLTGAGTQTTKVDVLVDSSGTVIWAYREDIVIVPNSVGGDTSGIKVPFSIYNDGSRTSGTWNTSTKTFTPASESTDEDDEDEHDG